MFRFQILAGEQAKKKTMRPILGMLQTSKINMPESEPNFNSNNNNIDNHLNVFETLHDESNTAMNPDVEKNPIINKRILLKVNGDDGDAPFLPPLGGDTNGNIDNDINAMDELNALPAMTKQKHNKSETVENGIRDKMIFDKKRLTKSLPETVAPANELPDKPISKEGRIVVYGDSNCLDATHTEKEKSCFWLLDALLEYTMTSHVSGLLKDLNRSANIRFDAMAANQMPKRLPNNNLHLYSKVLMPMPSNDNSANDNNDLTNKAPMPLVKRPRPECRALVWETPIFLNISAPNDFQYLNGYKDDADADASNMVDELNLRRKLESQKGEVCSVFEFKNESFSLILFFSIFVHFDPSFCLFWHRFTMFSISPKV